MIFKYFTIDYYKKYRQSFYLIRNFDEEENKNLTFNDKIIFIFILLLVVLFTFKSDIINNHFYELFNLFHYYFRNNNQNYIKNIEDGKNIDNINNIKEIFKLLDN